MRKLLLLIIPLTLLVSCWRRSTYEIDRHLVWGYKPVYSQDLNLLKVKFDTARPVNYPGKIYTKGELIFQNEIGYGIHVFDKSNLPQLAKTGFIHVPGNTDISIKGNFLYANSYSDLLVIDISNLNQPLVVKRIADAFNRGGYSNQAYVPLPEPGFPAACINNKDGIHIGWVKDSIYACY